MTCNSSSMKKYKILKPQLFVAWSGMLLCSEQLRWLLFHSSYEFPSWFYLYSRALLVFNKVIQRINNYWFKVHRLLCKEGTAQSFWCVFHYFFFFLFFPLVQNTKLFCKAECIQHHTIPHGFTSDSMWYKCLVDLFVVNRKKNPNLL